MALSSEVKALQMLVQNSNNKVNGKCSTLNILSEIQNNLDKCCLDYNAYDGLAASLTRNIDGLREFVVGDKSNFMKLEEIIIRISELRKIVSKDKGNNEHNIA